MNGCVIVKVSVDELVGVVGRDFRCVEMCVA